MREENWSNVTTYGVSGAILVCTWGIWQYLRGSYRPPISYKLHGKTVVITGANTGVGFATACQLARNGASIILACRNEKLGQEAAKRIILETGNKAVAYQYLDLTSLKSIRTFSSNVERCHVLVNNAGAMFSEPVFLHDVEKTFFTNYLGPFLLTKLMLPVLVRSSLEDNAEVRVVMVGSRSEKSSKLSVEYNNRTAESASGDTSDEKKMWFETCTRGPQPYELWTAYGTSKLCDMLFAHELDRRLARNKYSSLAVAANIPHQTASSIGSSDSTTRASTPPDHSNARITVNSVTPGMVNSDLARWAPLWKLYLSYPVRASMLKTVDQGAEGVAYVCASPALSGVSGKYYADGQAIESSPASHDPNLARDLWNESEKLLQKIEEE